VSLEVHTLAGVEIGSVAGAAVDIALRKGLAVAVLLAEEGILGALEFALLVDRLAHALLVVELQAEELGALCVALTLGLASAEFVVPVGVLRAVLLHALVVVLGHTLALLGVKF
jgi:hypothetical protein